MSVSAALPLSLPGALAYGVADVAGGLASRRLPVQVVTAGVQVVGFVGLLPVVLLAGGTPSVGAFVLGALSGLAGAGGLLLYLRGLAVGPMGVVAPLSAVVGAGLPLLIGIATGERPSLVTLLAIGVALVAILLASAGASGGGTGGRAGPLLALGAGVGFGLFFVALNATPAESGLWPLLAGRLASTPLLIVLAVVAGTRAGRVSPDAGTAGLMVVSGVCDAAANLLFLLATRAGDLGVSAVVVSLYPVVVVVAARVVLRERLTRMQIGSAGLALGASVLLAIGG